MKTQHTPGPWVANEDGLVYSTNQRLRKHNVICAVHPTNAALIAAAPELLAALKDLCNSFKWCNEDYDSHESYIAASAAIAKAGGVQ